MKDTRNSKTSMSLDESEMSNIHSWYLVKAMILSLPLIAAGVFIVFVIAYWILN